ncbi:MAG: IS110 family transposase [Planctomycetaceae bacterium]|nr:MAG: IS110 family transposase [Planctomycetaceae bacterium]
MLKTQVLAQDRGIALGLDVDARSVAVAALDVANGEIVFQGRLSHDEADWQRFLQHFPDCRLWACYEAGYTGFHLCRMLKATGVDCHVVAPSQVPKSPNSSQQKTDRRDALMLAQLYFHPPRTFVRVPTEQEEQDRQLLRTREQVVRDHTRTQNRIKALLAFHHREALKPHPWTVAEKDALRKASLPAAVRAALDVHLDTLERLEIQLRGLNRQLVALSREDRFHDRCALLREIPGVGPLTAMAFLLEVFRPEDFPTAEALACHVGLTCCEWSSGRARHQGHITHWGSPILRRMLVEAAWSWVRKDEQAKARFAQISQNGKRKKTAIVGMARRLAIAFWAMTVKGEPFAYRFAA